MPQNSNSLSCNIDPRKRKVDIFTNTTSKEKYLEKARIYKKKVNC